MYTNFLKSIKNSFKNKSQNQGFTLIELVVGLMIGSILLTSSLAIYQNIAKSTTIIQKITSNDTRAMILKDRFAKDLIGISMLWFTPKKYEAMKKKTTSSSSAKAKDSQNSDSENEEAENKKEDTIAKDENNFFFANNNADGTLDTLSFVTTSALQIYGSNNKSFVRVVYFLKKDQKLENSLSLMRKEIDPTELNKELLKNSGVFYELAGNIKHCSFEYGFINKITVVNKNEKQNANKPTEISWVKEWNEKMDKSQSSTQKPIAPKFIKIKITFMQQTTSAEQEYDMCFINPVDTISPYTSFTQKRYDKEQRSQPKISSGADRVTNSNDVSRQTT